MVKNKNKRIMITLNSVNLKRFNALVEHYQMNMSDLINELIIQEYYRKEKIN